jgi:hypothetical protein
MTTLTEATAQALLREQRKANALAELQIPLFLGPAALQAHYGRGLDWVKAQAERHLGYRPRRGVEFRLTRAQVLRLDYALEGEAAQVFAHAERRVR